MPDKIIFKEPGITLETPPEPAGPLELANLMVELRQCAVEARARESRKMTKL
jgi:hypothetical protein